MQFELPIFYCKSKNSVSPTMCEDLELIEGKNEETKSIYEYVFSPETENEKKSSKKWFQYYTSDVNFLKESKKFYKSMNENKIDKEGIENTWKIWNDVKKDKKFIETYKYIEWDRIQFLNYSVIFLTFLSYYNMFSPIINLLIPIIILFIPFFILRFMKLPISFSKYKDILLKQLKNHIIGKMFTEFDSVKMDKKIYMVFSFLMYVLNIYQNILSCYKFYKNMFFINDYFSTIKNYMKYSIDQMDFVISNSTKLKTYQEWINSIKDCRSILDNAYNKIKIIDDKPFSFQKISQLGYTMKQFYMLYDCGKIEKAMAFSFDFNSYVGNIMGLNKNIKGGYINYPKYTKKYSTKLGGLFYPALMYSDHVKNSITFKTNKIITGPNAAGKTTMIKSAIISILLSQQIGCGFFSKATINPYNHIHCYINIPDTSGRDSLFQAEARRCKHILNVIKKYPHERHFCIFDELYSGTNPYEAVSSAYSFLLYISNNPNVKFMLTTHYIKLCQLCKGKNNIKNYNMETFIKGHNSNYTYNLVSGISKIKGGIYILKQLKYPRAIIDLTQKIIDKM